MRASKGPEVEALRQRVDRGVAPFARDLNQAQLGEVGAITHELGVEGDERLPGQLVAELGELGGPSE